MRPDSMQYASADCWSLKATNLRHCRVGRNDEIRPSVTLTENEASDVGEHIGCAGHKGCNTNDVCHQLAISSRSLQDVHPVEFVETLTWAFGLSYAYDMALR